MCARDCYDICNQFCIHGEENAIRDAISKGHELRASRMYHIKVKDGEVRTSGQPSCLHCANKVLQEGIAEFVLKHDEGYGLYDSREFYELSLESVRLSLR